MTATITPASGHLADQDVDGADTAVSLEGVTKTFGDFTAVKELDLRIPRGEFFSMLGPSGSGKTTVLRMIAGFERPSAGRILLDDADVTDAAPFDRDVNTVFQDYALFPHMTIAQNVGYGLTARRVPKETRRRQVHEALERVQLAHVADRLPSQLSGGQRQRIALARALILQPRVLLLDEPLGALDKQLREQMQIELKQIQRDVGITFVFVTHDQEEALTLSDRVAVFNEGRIEQVGTPVEVYERPASPFVAGFLGAANIVDAARAAELFGRPAQVSIRPERIRLAAAGAVVPSELRSLEGTVAEVVYAGPHTTYVVDVAGLQLMATVPNTSRGGVAGHQRGDAVRLLYAASDVYDVPEKSAP